MTARSLPDGAFAAAVAMAVTWIAAAAPSAQIEAKGRSQPVQTSGLPVALRKASIAAQSDKRGEIAGARIGGTKFHVVYLRTARGCGSGGCRAQIWRRDGEAFIRHWSLPVGRLPIVVLDHAVDGMPDLGVTQFDKGTGGNAILPVEFDGTGYDAVQVARLLPPGSGTPLIDEGMITRF